MSLLDDNFDLSHEDVIRSQVIDFIKNDASIGNKSIDLKKGFFHFHPRRVELVKYDDNPINWKILTEKYTNNFYIARNPDWNIISDYGLCEVMINVDGIGYLPLTIGMILSENLKYSQHTLYINIY